MPCAHLFIVDNGLRAPRESLEFFVECSTCISVMGRPPDADCDGVLGWGSVTADELRRVASAEEDARILDDYHSEIARIEAQYPPPRFTWSLHYRRRGRRGE